MSLISDDLHIKYKIIPLASLIKWCNKNVELCLQIENIINVHRNNESFKIDAFLTENQSECCKLVGQIIILIEKSKIIGIARCNATEVRNNTYVYYISGVHIREEYRGKHLCYTMLTLLINSNEPAVYELDVDITNMAAIRCYQKLGFVIMARHFIYNKLEYAMQLNVSKSI